jgi:hypothetical protein
MADDSEYNEELGEFEEDNDDGGKHAAAGGDDANVEGEFEEEALEEDEDAGARGGLNVDAATHGIVKMQARARGMLTRKHDAEELAQMSTATKAEARAERRAALGKPLDADADGGKHAAAGVDDANVEGEFEEEALEEDEDAGARGGLNVDAATHGIVKMQARARGMLTRKHDAEELAQMSTATKAEARAERRAALGKPLDADADGGKHAAAGGDDANVEGEFEEEALEEDEDAGARGGLNVDAATHGIVKMQARARGMLTRKHDAEELAQMSTATKAEARAERRAALGKPLDADADGGKHAAAGGDDANVEGEFEEEALEEDEDAGARGGLNVDAATHGIVKMQARARGMLTRKHDAEELAQMSTATKVEARAERRAALGKPLDADADGGKHAAAGGDDANVEGEFEEEALEEDEDAGARGGLNVDAATHGIVKMQARARGMLTRKHDAEELAQMSTATKVEARAERRAALGKPLDADADGGKHAAAGGDDANVEGEFEEEALEEDEDAGARGGLNVDAATHGIVKMQARARGMLTRKHDAEELAQMSTATKAEARAERRAALGKPLDADADGGKHAAAGGDDANVEGEFEEEALEEDEDAGARGGLNVDAATHGIVKMQARARGMLTRKHDAEELAQMSTATKAEARAERRAALGKPLDADADGGKHAAADGNHVNSSLSIDRGVVHRHGVAADVSPAPANSHHHRHNDSVQFCQSSDFIASPPSSRQQVSKSSPRSALFSSRSPDYEDLEALHRSPGNSTKDARQRVGISSNLNTSEYKKPSETSVSFTSPRSSPGIAAPAPFSLNASAAPGDPVSQALLKKLFAIEQSVSLLQAQIVKCLASDDTSVYDQLHNSNVQVEKLMRIRSEILVALQHQQQMAATSPKVAGPSSFPSNPHKFNSVSPLDHSSKTNKKNKDPPAPMEFGYMSDNASSTTFSASSHTNGDFSSSVSHSALSASEDLYCIYDCRFLFGFFLILL